MRKPLGIGSARGSEGAVTTHLVGQGALWAGLQEVSKEDLPTAESQRVLPHTAVERLKPVLETST